MISRFTFYIVVGCRHSKANNLGKISAKETIGCSSTYFIGEDAYYSRSLKSGTCLISLSDIRNSEADVVRAPTGLENQVQSDTKTQWWRQRLERSPEQIRRSEG